MVKPEAQRNQEVIHKNKSLVHSNLAKQNQLIQQILYCFIIEQNHYNLLNKEPLVFLNPLMTVL